MSLLSYIVYKLLTNETNLNILITYIENNSFNLI